MKSDKELTDLLIGVDFGKPMKGKPKYHKSTVTGNMYDYMEYTNHGYGGVKHGYMDLPKDEYPYLLIY